MESHTPEMGQRYWDLQNYITGFALAEMAAFLIATATSDGVRDGVVQFRTAVAGAIAASGFLYLIGVWLAFLAERRLCPSWFERKDKACLVLWGTLAARTVTIVLVHAVGVSIVCFVIAKSPLAR